MSEVETAAVGSVEAAADGGEEASAPQRQWYIVHTYSGYEERVRETLRQRAEAHGLGHVFGEVRIPTETIVELKGGKKRETQRKFFPGYILIEIECEQRGDGRLKISDEAWHVVKDTPKVTGFVGTGKGADAARPGRNRRDHREGRYREGEAEAEVPVREGRAGQDRGRSLHNFTGTVEEINLDRSTLKVMVTIFGRQTPVELEFLQVQKT